MDFKQALGKRIVIVFTLMSTVVAGIFAIGIILTVHVVERKLTTISLGGNLHRLLLVDNVNGWTHRPEKDELFYAQDGQGELALSGKLLGLAPGFQEVLLDNLPYYAMVRVVKDRKYVLLRNQQSLEQRERLLFAVVFAGFVLSILLATLLGKLLARRVMAPVINLARQVRHRDRLLGLAPALSPDYAADEVGELAHSFDQTLGKLRAALEREQLFTSDVSHELRTPLMVLASSCELLLANPGLDQRAHRQVERIARASQEMSELIETFLLLARARDEETSVAEQVGLKTVADALVEVWRGPIQEKGLSFIYTLEQDAPGLYNKTFLHSVMGNLLRNACHYTDKGYVRLTLKANGFMVEDSGIGIPEEKRHAMFQLFVRGDEQRGDGLGLGLSLVQRICATQGWQVILTDNEPHGCRFTVQFGVS